VQSYYQALALRKLGHDQEARATLHSLLEFARQKKQVEPRIDYFATSLPNLLLFKDDLTHRNLVESLLLEAFAELGMGNSETAISLFHKVQSLDPNNFEAAQEIRRLSALEASSVEG
jgi:Flp pilus assembly protein TadD